MSISTNLISGLSSGFDWRSMIDQLMAIEQKRVTLVDNKKSDYESQLKEWQSFNTKLLALKTAAGNLKDPYDFALFTSTTSTNSGTFKASDLLSVTTNSDASIGTYTLNITQLAAAEKLSSASFSDYSTALGAGYAGDMLINGRAVSITQSDSLADVRDKINSANSGSTPSGVTASIIRYDTNDYRLTLTSDDTGEAGIGLLNGSAADILSVFGFTDATRTVKNHIAGGDKSDCFTSSTIAVKTLLGLSSTQSSNAGDIIVNGCVIDAIDLSMDSLESIKDKLVAAGVSASVISETSNNEVSYRILIEGGTNTYTDGSNILETLGIIEGGVSSVMGVMGDISNTSSGSYINGSTLLQDIDGYVGHQPDDYILFTGIDTDGTAVSDGSFTITATTTIQDLLTKIEELYGNVTASVTADGKINVIDNTTGTSVLSAQMAVKNADDSDDDTLNFATDDDLGTAWELRKRQLVAGQDARLLIDGVEVTTASNTVNDIIGGVTLNLLQSDADTTITLNITHDIDSIMEEISTFVNAYNTVAAYISEQQSYDEDKEKTGGILFGDGTLSSVKTDLTSVLLQSVWGVNSKYSIMGLVGINLDNDGLLNIDSDTLRGYLTTNFNDVKLLFSSNGTAGSGSLEYVSHTQNTSAGEYTVHITQAATRACETGTADLSGGLSGDETLTITAGDRSATIELTNGTSLSAIVNEVNTELDTVYTETHVGANQLYEGSGESQAVASTTTWDQVYVGAIAANLANGDIISFEGTTRSGAETTGNYMIQDTTTDTIRGLLSAIETAYNNDVTALIDSSGRISVTDKYAGDSKVSITFDFTQAHDLDFGTVATDNPGGQEGRFAIPITASTDGSGHLVLTHDSYGSANSFTISATGNLGLDNTIFTGLDVAGTINGESATGRGQSLTGNSGETNIAGLVIKYSGTETGDAGTVRLTVGVAELFDRALFNITDPYEGYVAFKKDSLQTSIKDFETRIEAMEAFLNRKMETMLNRFVMMETALNKIQAQSDWLTGQLNASYNAWYW
ncbi:MAG TPA: flagellar hook protein [Deltaproteobacteria bacterium]|nr:flagellar hook protein [Deltaproteobacteria bacterium]